MSEETEVTLNDLENAETDAEEQVETEDVESEEVTDESDVGDSTDDESSQEGDELEEYETEADYLKAKGIESDDFDTFFENYKSSQDEFSVKSKQIEQIEAVLKARGIDGGLAGLMSGAAFERPTESREKPPPKVSGDSYFSESPFSDAFKEIEYQVTAPNTKTFYQQFNKMADKAISPQLKKMEEIYTVMVQNVLANQSAIKDMRWATLQHPGKDMVTKEQFQAAVKTYGIDDPKKIMDLLAISSPEMLKVMTTKAEKKGIEKGKKYRKFKKGMKRGKTGAKSVNWKAFLNRDGSINRRKLDSELSHEEGMKVLDAIEKATK